jgi:archaellum component FlaC
MTDVDFQERIAVEFETLTTMLNSRLDALDEIAESLDRIASTLEAIGGLYEHQHRL